RTPKRVVGVGPGPGALGGVLRCEEIIPQYNLEGREAEPDDACAVRAWLTEHGGSPDLDMVAEGETPADDPGAASARVTPWAAAGCTWWIENRWELPEGTTDPVAVGSGRAAAGPARPPG